MLLFHRFCVNNGRGKRNEMFADTKRIYTFAYSCKRSPRNLIDIQNKATCGVFGKIPNKVNSFESLSRKELRQELVSRQIYDFPPNNKKAMTDILKDHLCGVQRVPALLLLNTTADLWEMNLLKYTVLSFEPLHDLKGHIANLLGQLPNVINQPVVKSKMQDYLDNFNKKPKFYGSDYREALIQVMHILVNCQLNSDDPVYVLISTLVKISEIVYSNDSRRTLRQCLQFYNCSFLHHELCVGLLYPKRVSIYFHSLLVHGPVQHELVCSQSVNAEAEERLFKQAGNAAKNTDHKIDGFVEALLVKLQCKQLDASPDLNICHKQISSENSRITKAALALPQYRGSHFSKSFIQNHLSDFQSHLQRIAHYLIHGEGVWWYKTDSGSINFSDSDLDPEYHTEGPSVLHHRVTTLKDVSSRASQCWQEILHNKISIPIRVVRRYDTQGLMLNATEIDLDSTQSTNDLPTMDTTDSDLMDTTPLVGNDVEVDCYLGDSVSLSTGEVPVTPATSTPQKKHGTACLPDVTVPITTSTPQKECATCPPKVSAPPATSIPQECGMTCLLEDTITSSGVAVNSNDDTTAMVNTQITEPHEGTEILKSALEYRQHIFQSKLTQALLKLLGYYPELDELDKLRTTGNTSSNEYMRLKHFFRQQIV